MEVRTSSDAMRLIHMSLGKWVEGALEDGFCSDPVDRAREGNHYAKELMHIAEIMREIENNIDV